MLVELGVVAEMDVVAWWRDVTWWRGVGGWRRVLRSPGVANRALQHELLGVALLGVRAETVGLVVIDGNQVAQDLLLHLGRDL